MELPSWILQVTQAAFGTPEDSLNGRKNGDSLVGLPTRKFYNASAGKMAFCEFRTTDRNIQRTRNFTEPYKWILVVRGFQLGKITKRSAACAEGIIWKECLEMGGWQEEESGAWPDRLWRTLVADRGLDGNNPPCWYRRACVHCLANVTNNGNLDTRDLIADLSQPDLMKLFLMRVQRIT